MNVYYLVLNDSPFEVGSLPPLRPLPTEQGAVHSPCCLWVVLTAGAPDNDPPVLYVRPGRKAIFGSGDV